jgi:hypothetical protein
MPCESADVASLLVRSRRLCRPPNGARRRPDAGEGTRVVRRADAGGCDFSGRPPYALPDGGILAADAQGP